MDKGGVCHVGRCKYKMSDECPRLPTFGLSVAMPMYYRELHEALRLVREYMNLIERHYHDSGQGYEHFIMHSDGEWGANDLATRSRRWTA
jgi:hypothetical protein